MKRSVLACVAAVFCVCHLGSAQAQDRVTLRYGQIANSARSVSALGLYVAQRKGFLAKHGLKDGDFRTKELGGTPVRAECLSMGDCDAVPLGQPEDVVFMQNGFTKLGDSLEVIPVLQFSVVAARRSWAEANKAVVVRFARAFGNA